MGIKIQILSGLIILAFFNFSCTSTVTLYKGFSKNKASLKYIYDSEPEPEKNSYTIGVKRPTISDSKFTLPGSVRKIKGSVVPVIVYTEWKNQYEYNIGKSVIQEDVTTFVRSSFIEESKRSGSYSADTVSLTDQLALEIEIDSIGAKGPYYEQGYILFLVLAYSYSFSESAGPGLAYSRFHYTLRRGDEIVLDDYVSSHHTSQPLKSHHSSTQNLRSYYSTNLVEALSLTFKTNIEAIVKNINILLDIKMQEASK